MQGFDFIEKLEEQVDKTNIKPLKLLIIDDEADIHTITKMVLSDFEFEGRPLEFLSTYSKAETIELLKTERDISAMLVDVVMETNNAGLELIDYIRNTLDNNTTRIILRTGQPGEAPEESVIREYDINDYKNKTELTALKLKTTIFTAMRSYRDLKKIEIHKNGLERIIECTNELLVCNNINLFGCSMLEQLANVLGIDQKRIVCCIVKGDLNAEMDYEILATSNIKDFDPQHSTLPDDILTLFQKAIEKESSFKLNNSYIGYSKNDSGKVNLIYIEHLNNFDDENQILLEVFNKTMCVMHENLAMKELIKESQRELSYILGEAVEKRSKETGAHVKRVAEFSGLLASLYGLSPLECDIIKMASPLHDIGKIAIPDNILNKPDKLNSSEWEIMKTHAEIGGEILQNSNNIILKKGSIIANQHHEKYDGSGYPQGLKGEDIDIVGRITAVADVFDALASERCYKPAWLLEDAISYMKEQSGTHFDPKIINLLLDNLSSFILIRDTYPDKIV